MERRGATRFRLRLAVVFSWRDEHGIVQGSEGWSRDLSSRGIYVRAETVPPVGAAVEMNVFLPEPGYQIRAAELHAKGQSGARRSAQRHSTRLRGNESHRSSSRVKRADSVREE